MDTVVRVADRLQKSAEDQHRVRDDGSCDPPAPAYSCAEDRPAHAGAVCVIPSAPVANTEPFTGQEKLPTLPFALGTTCVAKAAASETG